MNSCVSIHVSVHVWPKIYSHVCMHGKNSPPLGVCVCVCVCVCVSFRQGNVSDLLSQLVFVKEFTLFMMKIFA